MNTASRTEAADSAEDAAEQPPERAAVQLELPLQAAAVRLWSVVSGTLLLLISSVWTTIAVVKAGALGLIALLPAALLLGLSIYYWRAYARHFGCVLLEDGLLVRRGVWWRKEVFVPRSRIQHTEVNQGPYARRYDLAQIAVYTAGTHAAKVEVDGLAAAEAFGLRDQLLGRDGHDAV